MAPTATFLLGALAFASLCAFNTPGHAAILFGAFVSVFALPVAYQRENGQMTRRRDLHFVGSVALFLATALVTTPLLCIAVPRADGAVCQRPDGFVIIILPGLVFTLGIWGWFRLGKRL